MRAGVWAVAVLAGGMSASAQLHVIGEGAQDRVHYLASEQAVVEATLAGPVKGAPYSAEAVTETTRMLADGNRIRHKGVAKVYRDSQGRVRREQAMEAVGPWTAAEPVELITISDPAAKVSYSLDPRDRTARKMLFHGVPGGVGGGVSVGVGRGVPGGMGGGAPSGVRVERGHQQHPAEFGPEVTFEKPVPAPEVKTESLGRRSIEGVEAEGTRTTTVIPAGQMGNERPIEIVNERWYSRELRAVVYSKRTDPLVGETVYQLVNVNRSEPPAYLFQVPPDYQVKESAIQVTPHRHESAPK